MNPLNRVAIFFAIAVAAVAISEAQYQLDARSQMRWRDAQPAPTFADEVARALAADTGYGERPGRSWMEQGLAGEPAACHRLLDSVGVVNPTSRALLDSSVVNRLLAQSPCGLRLHPPRLGLDLTDEEGRTIELRHLLLLLGLTIGIAATHSNRGWRRLAAAIGAMSGGVFALYLSTQAYRVEVVLWQSLLVAASTAAAVAVVKEVADWVRAGFRSDA